MARGIKLRRYEISQANHYHLHGFRLKVDVEAVSGGMLPEIFVFNRCPPDPNTGDSTDRFLTVASFVDMSDWPVGNPDPDKGLPFFRKSAVELDLRSMSDYNAVWELLVSEANNLCYALDRADILVPAESQWAGTKSDESSDSDLSDL
jgi:hypothetical protein